MITLSILPATTPSVLPQTSSVDRLLRFILDDLWGTAADTLSGLTGIDMLASPFMQRAYLAAICIAIIGPLVGSFLVHREMAMIADTLAHSAFAGVAVGLFVNATFSVVVAPLVTALLVAAIAALLVQTLVDSVGTYRDTSLAIVLTGAFALGSVLITATEGGIAVGINAYLFGSLATVSRANAAVLFAMSVAVTLAVVIAYRPLVYVTFDEIGARAAGLQVSRYNQLLAVLTAVVVVGAMQIMGVILVAAMLVIPVATATSVRGFKRAIGASICAGFFATITGVTLSYVYGVAAGGTIVLVAIGVYLLAKIGPLVRRRLSRHQSLTTTPASKPSQTDGGDDESVAHE